jgi:hypothetical protein
MVSGRGTGRMCSRINKTETKNLALLFHKFIFLSSEFSDLPLSSPFSYIFFLVFLFLIVVVLMNLLNGLAVTKYFEQNYCNSSASSRS